MQLETVEPGKAARDVQRPGGTQRPHLKTIRQCNAANSDALMQPDVPTSVSDDDRPLEKHELHVIFETGLNKLLAEIDRLARLEFQGRFESGRLSSHNQLRAEVMARISFLTSREAEVMDLILHGKTQKQIAAELGISIQTAAKHRAKVLEKLRVANDVELVRLTMALDVPA